MRSLQGAEDQRVPSNARAKSASGSQQTGWLMNLKSLRGSVVTSREKSQIAIRMEKMEVDHGSAAATRTSSRSRLKIRAAGLCQPDSMNESVDRVEGRPSTSASTGTIP